MNILYLDLVLFKEIVFPYVAGRYGRIEEVPNYLDDTEGIAQLEGVIERSKIDVFYPGVLEKTTQILIEINKGHFFGNGNKRLALVTSVMFLFLNDKDFKDESEEFYKAVLCELFPEFKDFCDFPDFSATEYATYNLSIIIADSGKLGIEHQDLKDRVLKFFAQVTEEIPDGERDYKPHWM